MRHGYTVFSSFLIDNFAHRAAVRKALAQDTEWQDRLSAILPLVYKQDMEIAYQVPWCQLGTSPKPGELWYFSNMQLGGGVSFGKSAKQCFEGKAEEDD